MRVTGAALFRGQAVDTRALVTLGGDDELDFYTPCGFDILGLVVDEGALEAHARTIEHRDVATVFDGKGVLNPDPARLDLLRRLLLSALQSPDVESLGAAVPANAAPARASADGCAHRRRRRRRRRRVAEAAVPEPPARRRRREGVHAQPHRPADLRRRLVRGARRQPAHAAIQLPAGARPQSGALPPRDAPQRRSARAQGGGARRRARCSTSRRGGASGTQGTSSPITSGCSANCRRRRCAARGARRTTPSAAARPDPPAATSARLLDVAQVQAIFPDLSLSCRIVATTTHRGRDRRARMPADWGRQRMQRTKALGLVLGLAMLAATGSAAAFGKDSLVWKKCADCHAPAADGRIRARGRPADDAGGMDGHRRPDAAAARNGARHGRDGRAAEGVDRHADPHPRRTGSRVVPQPVAQLPAGGGSRRQGGGTALHHLRALPHGGQDLLVPDDPRPVDEGARLPPRGGADGDPADARDALDRRSRRGARVPRTDAALRQSMGGARGETRRSVGRVRSRARQRRVPGRGPDHRRRQRRIQADGQPHLRRRHLGDLRGRGHALRRLRAAHAHEEQRLRRERRVHRGRRRDARRVALPCPELPHIAGAMAAQRRRHQSRARTSGFPRQGRADHTHRSKV